MVGGTEARNFNSNISLRTTIPGKTVSGKDTNSTGEKTINSSVMSVGDATTTSTNRFHTGNNLEDDNEIIFTSSIATT